MTASLKGKTIILGIGGGIAAYKCCDLVRSLVASEAEVHVILTAAAKAFVTPLTLQTLSRHPVRSELLNLDEESQMNHIHLVQSAHLIIVAPATADLIARIHAGLCNDLLTTLITAAACPLLLVPSMNTHMWENPITQRNVRALKELGTHFLDPEVGELACGTSGAGRLPEIETIINKGVALIT